MTLPAVETPIQQVRRHRQAVRRVRRDSIGALVDRAQALALQATPHALFARCPTLGSQLPHDTRATIAATMRAVDGGDFHIQGRVRLRPRAGWTKAPLAISAARNAQNLA